MIDPNTVFWIGFALFFAVILFGDDAPYILLLAAAVGLIIYGCNPLAEAAPAFRKLT